MYIQISFDTEDTDKALAICPRINDYCDGIEIGNLLLLQEGVSIIKKIKNTTKKSIFVDAKIIEHGERSANLIFTNGGDSISVMAGTSKNVIHSVANASKHLNKKSALDISDSQSPGQSALEAESLGINSIIFNQVYNLDEPHVFLDKWEIVRGNTNLPIYISGKINRDNIEQVLAVKPDGIIIGKAIIDAIDPEKEAKYFYDFCNG